MAYLSGKDCAHLFVDGVDVAVSNNGVNISSEAVCPKRRPLGQAYKTAFPTGQVDSELSITGWLDSTTEEQLRQGTADAKVISVLFGGNAHSQLFAGLATAYVSGAKLGMADDDLDSYEPVLVTSDCKANIGYVVAPYAQRTTAGNTDTDDAQRDAAAASSGRAFLHIAALSLGGYDNVIVTVRHSSDGITYVNHTSFAAMTAVGAQSIALATTVNQYLSIGWAYTGSGSSPSWSGFVGVAVD